MLVHSKERRRFTKPEVQFLEALAYGAAIAEMRFRSPVPLKDWKSELMRAVHQIRDPLYGIDYVLHRLLLQASEQLSESSRRQLRLSRTWLTDIDHSLENLLLAAAGEADAPDPRFALIEDLVQENHFLYREWAEQMGVRMDAPELHGLGGVSVAIGPRRLRLLLANVVRNALRVASRARAAEASIQLKAFDAGTAVRVEIHAPWGDTSEAADWRSLDAIHDPLGASDQMMEDLLKHSGGRLERPSKGTLWIHIPTSDAESSDA